MTYKTILLISIFPLALHGARQAPYVHSMHHQSRHNHQFFHPQFGPPHSIHYGQHNFSYPFGQPRFGSIRWQMQWNAQQNSLRYQSLAHRRKRKRDFANHPNPAQAEMDAKRAEIDEASRQRVPVIDERPFYDKNKKAIWIGSGLLVAGLMYFVGEKLGLIGEAKKAEKENNNAIPREV